MQNGKKGVSASHRRYLPDGRSYIMTRCAMIRNTCNVTLMVTLLSPCNREVFLRLYVCIDEAPRSSVGIENERRFVL